MGTCMGSMVWILIIYSVLTISLLAQNQKLPNGVAMLYSTISALALACHAKTTFTDPGSIPQEAVPREALFRKGITTHAMCSHCQTYKPPLSHHCRICNRCVSRMDHHCPWMNNCVGANNFSEYLSMMTKKSILQNYCKRNGMDHISLRLLIIIPFRTHLVCMNFQNTSFFSSATHGSGAHLH